jgi:hypothetical protein
MSISRVCDGIKGPSDVPFSIEKHELRLAAIDVQSHAVSGDVASINAGGLVHQRAATVS